MTVEPHPTKLPGPWKAGYALDWRTRSSRNVGTDANGRPIFETIRSDVGEFVYRLKYHGEKEQIHHLVTLFANFLRGARWPVEIVVSVPPSRADRRFQPVPALARQLSQSVGLVYAANALRSVRPIPELKSLDEATDRDQILSGAFAADASAVRGRTVLLIDDVFRSGATRREAGRALDEAGAAAVYALVATRTRVKR